MTEQEAQRMLNEHRADFPVFVRGRQRYTVRRDGRVDIEDAVGKSGKRWAWGLTVDADSYALPPEVRKRAAEKKGTA